MKLLPLALAGTVALSACSTAGDRTLPEPEPAAAAQDTDESRIEPDGPSATPREGWVETVSGWYPSREACLRHGERDMVGTPLSVAEACLEPNR